MQKSRQPSTGWRVRDDPGAVIVSMQYAINAIILFNSFQTGHSTQTLANFKSYVFF